MNKYYLKARFYPALLTSLPILVLTNGVLITNKDSFVQLNTMTTVLVNAGVLSALAFLLVQINRVISKEIFQRLYFQDELKMPTVDFLLSTSVFFDHTIKNTIREKIVKRYSVTLLGYDEEKNDEPRARKLIATAISQIRNELRENKILLQHNIEYGFARNLLGGSLIAFMISVISVCYSVHIENTALQFTGVVLALLYLFPLLMSKAIINYYGRIYAKILFEQFLSLQ